MNKLSNNLDFKLINKFHNINLYANITGTHTFTLNETIKNVRSIKLISAELVGLKSGAWDSKHIVILHIDELKYNTISSTKENNKLNNSFLTFDIYDRFNPTGVFYHFYNKFLLVRYLLGNIFFLIHYKNYFVLEQNQL